MLTIKTNFRKIKNGLADLCRVKVNMTRFARAKGSKASNERVPEEATSWSEMKKQLLEQNDDKMKEVHQQRQVNYKNFLETLEKDENQMSWADFSDSAKTNSKSTVDDDDDEDMPLEMSAKLELPIFPVTTSKKKKNKPLKIVDSITSDDNNSVQVLMNPKKKKRQFQEAAADNATKKSKRLKTNDNDSDISLKKNNLEKSVIKGNKRVKIVKEETTDTSDLFGKFKEESSDTSDLVTVKKRNRLVKDFSELAKDKIKEEIIDTPDLKPPKKRSKLLNEVDSSTSEDKIKNKKKTKKKTIFKKDPSELTESDLRKIEKSKNKKLRQKEKRKLKQEQLQKERELNGEPAEPPKPKKPKHQDDNQLQKQSGKFQTKLNVDGKKGGKFKKKKLKFDENDKRAKKTEEKMMINGKEVYIMYYDGFPIKKEDATRLFALKRQLIAKGLPQSEIKLAMKLERRRAEKALAREKKKVCFHCRKSGHNLSECPEMGEKELVESSGTGICFKCGSTEHTHFECKVVRGQDYKFAKCFICQEQGHIARQCPDNARGLYPKGGACRVCGDVTHLKKDCPTYQAQQQQQNSTVDTMDSHGVEDLDVQKDVNVNKVDKKVNKIIKF